MTTPGHTLSNAQRRALKMQTDDATERNATLTGLERQLLDDMAAKNVRTKDVENGSMNAKSMNRFSPFASVFRPFVEAHSMRAPLGAERRIGHTAEPTSLDVDNGKKDDSEDATTRRTSANEVAIGAELREHLIIESINRASLNTNCESLLERKARFVGLQEYSTPTVGQGSTKAYGAACWTLEMGPCDPEHARPSGGVGLLSRTPTLGVPIVSNTPE